MVNEISIFQTKTLVARLLVKANASWSTPTTVLRFLSEGSTEYCFFVSDAAMASVRDMQPGRIYSVTVPFKTVKANDPGPGKYFGISCNVAVRLRHPLQYALVAPGAAATFGATVSFDFTSLAALDQVEDGGYVDLLGRVVEIDASQLMNALPKKNVTIANGDYYENVEFLGNHAGLGVVVGQIIACKGLQLKSWKGSRTCTTTLLSYICLDPGTEVGTVAEPSTGESPHKKAAMSKDCPRLTTLLIRDAATKMKREYEQNPMGPLPTAGFTVRGKVAPFTMDSFGGCPTFDKNGIAKIRFLADVSDVCGILERVTVWDAAAREMLKTDGSGLMALWNQCDDVEGQSTFLRAMNRAKDTVYDYVLEVVLREWKGQYSYQINVNAAVPVAPQ